RSLVLYGRPHAEARHSQTHFGRRIHDGPLRELLRGAEKTMWRHTVSLKRISLVLAVFAAPFFAHATCANCDKIVALQKKFDAYNYANHDDRDKGAEDIGQVDTYIQNFVNNSVQAQNKTDEFKA